MGTSGRVGVMRSNSLGYSLNLLNKVFKNADLTQASAIQAFFCAATLIILMRNT